MISLIDEVLMLVVDGDDNDDDGDDGDKADVSMNLFLSASWQRSTRPPTNRQMRILRGQ